MSWLARELGENAVVYAYLGIVTPVIFIVVGGLLGRAEDKLVEQATTDPLTGLGNRSLFDDAMSLEVARARRYQTALSLLLIDVDRLKAINDSGGHRAGDAALRAVRDAISATVRAADVPARIGGDEFAIVVPSTSAAEASHLADRIREALRLGRPGLTVSIGISDSCHFEADASRLVRAADAALYAAKRGGGDCSVVAPAGGLGEEGTRPPLRRAKPGGSPPPQVAPPALRSA
jgi:diguanylate cyclase (GGDEF)-like protein